MDKFAEAVNVITEGKYFTKIAQAYNKGIEDVNKLVKAMRDRQ